MRPAPWLIRIGLFALGFGVGVLHHGANPPQQPVVIELQIVMPDSAEKQKRPVPVSEVSFPLL